MLHHTRLRYVRRFTHGSTKFVLYFLLVLWTSLGASAATSPDSITKVMVTDVYRLTSDPSEAKDCAGIGDIIVIKVKGLATLLNRSLCVGQANCVKQEIRLFINGRMIKDLSPESGAPIRDEGTLQFHLQRNINNDEAWADILGAPTLGKNFFYRAAEISVGLENGYAEESVAKPFRLVRVRQHWFWFCAATMVLYLILLVVLARRSDVLRDRGADLSALGVAKVAGQTYPYSLGRFQMAFWFSLVIASFLFIWLITGAYDIVSTTVLALIGISTATSLSSAVIDNSKDEGLMTKTTALQEESSSLVTEIASLQQMNLTSPTTALATDISTKNARLLQINAEIKKNLKTLSPIKSKNFLLDILSDENGVSFHRLQMFTWTLILGILFVFSVWSRLSMPEFSATLLALQGITAGTYLGFKIPEK